MKTLNPAKALMLSTACTALVILAAPVIAQDKETAPVTAQNDATLENRVALAEKLQALRPAKDQVESAIERYAVTMPKEEQAAFRLTMQNTLNYKALEKISVDAYADTYTEAELAAMVEYFSKPEAKSASKKSEEYAKKVYPEIIRMLDRGMMKMKTGE